MSVTLLTGNGRQVQMEHHFGCGMACIVFLMIFLIIDAEVAFHMAAGAPQETIVIITTMVALVTARLLSYKNKRKLKIARVKPLKAEDKNFQVPTARTERVLPVFQAKVKPHKQVQTVLEPIQLKKVRMRNRLVQKVLVLEIVAAVHHAEHAAVSSS